MTKLENMSLAEAQVIVAGNWNREMENRVYLHALAKVNRCAFDLIQKYVEPEPCPTCGRKIEEKEEP